MKVLYVDPSLRFFLGHHANVCEALSGSLREQGHEVIVAISCHAEDKIKGQRSFRKPVYDLMALDPESRRDRAYLRAAAVQYCRELGTLLLQHNPNIVYAHSINAPACEGFLKAIDIVYGKDSRPSLVAEFSFSLDAPPPYFYREQLSDMFLRLQRRRSNQSKRFVAVTTDRQTSELLTREFDWRVEVFPSPYSLPELGAAPGRLPDAPVVIGCAGHQFTRKGYHYLPEIIKTVVDSGWPTQFTVQVQLDTFPETLEKLKQLEKRGYPVELVSKELSKSDYERFVERFDVFLLPYDPKAYESAMSGVLYEALSRGRVVVAPDHSAIGRIARIYQPESPQFETWEPKTIAASILDALRLFESLQLGALSGAARYREKNGPHAYMREVLARAGSETPRICSPIAGRLRLQMQQIERLRSKLQASVAKSLRIGARRVAKDR